VPRLASIHENDQLAWWRALWRAVGGDEASFPDRDLGAGDAQAGGFEIRPGLLRTAGADGVDVQPIALGEGLRHAGFDPRGETGKKGKGCGDKRSNSDGRKCLDH